MLPIFRLLLQPGDLVVVNNTKVMPARVPAHVRSTGKLIDLLFVQDLGQDVWEVFIKGRFRPGSRIVFPDGGEGEILERSQARTTLRFTGQASAYDLMQAAGAMPLPPYIKRLPTQDDLLWYQTMFAQREGAIAAPTAGLHFTRELVEALKRKGIELAEITLHVGPGTFRSVKSEQIEDHRMLAERVEVSAADCGADSPGAERGGIVWWRSERPWCARWKPAHGAGLASYHFKGRPSCSLHRGLSFRSLTRW